MTYSAYQNALKRRGELRQQLTEVEQKLAEVERFIREYHEYSGSSEPPKTPTRKPRPPDSRSPAEIAALRKMAPNPPSEEIARAVELILNDRGHPMTRGKLTKELSERGINLVGRDPTNVLGTLLFRLRERFVNIPKYGYWIADRPWAQADYDPSTWDEIQKQAMEKLRKGMRRKS